MEGTTVLMMPISQMKLIEIVFFSAVFGALVADILRFLIIKAAKFIAKNKE
jgi:hypothetical protein